MGLINGTLQIGRTGLNASQGAMSVAGNNMANAATPGFSRQSIHLHPALNSQIAPGIYAGSGVRLAEVRREVDQALVCRLRTAVSDQSSNLVLQQAMTRVETTFNELTEHDISSSLNSFLGSWEALQGDNSNTAKREIIIQEGLGLARTIQQIRADLSSLQDDLDEQVRFQVDQVNGLVKKIANLNSRISTASAGQSNAASSLKDERDTYLKELGSLIQISTRDTDSHAVNVFIGSDPLIQNADYREITFKEELDSNGKAVSEVVFADNEQSVQLLGGQLHGQITARDDQVGSIINDLDAWAKGVIYEVNRQHSLGTGLESLTAATSLFAVEDPTASLGDMDATGLSWAVDNGVFRINITDTSDPSNPVTTTHTVPVSIGMGGADTTLNSLAAQLDGLSGISASVDGANHLSIQADANMTFSFSPPENPDDATNALAVLGINSFFQGDSAGTMTVRDGLSAAEIASSSAYDTAGGNGTIAGWIAQLSDATTETFSGNTIVDEFAKLVAGTATETRAAKDNYTAASTVVQSLESERQSVSGVSVDEEAIHMITYQRAFQGAARLIGLVDQMMDEIMTIL